VVGQGIITIVNMHAGVDKVVCRGQQAEIQKIPNSIENLWNLGFVCLEFRALHFL
jgi:hypothetical protein